MQLQHITQSRRFADFYTFIFHLRICGKISFAQIYTACSLAAFHILIKPYRRYLLQRMSFLFKKRIYSDMSIKINFIIKIKSMKHTILSFYCSVFFIAFNQSAIAQDFDTVQIKTIKITDKIYMLEGSGGNIGVLVG